MKPQRKPNAIDIDHVRETTNRNQSKAADPKASVWVNANAGTGKTHVLTLRVLRLLLAGTKPERILCLTYTKAAAAEMSTRVFDRLAKWATSADEVVREELQKITGQSPSQEQLELARRLFTSAIETPGGLKVQTIHAFSERLLQRFPLEAGIAPDFRILDERATKDLKTECIEFTLSAAVAAPDSQIASAIGEIVRFAGEQRFDTLVASAVDERAWLTAASRYEPEAHDDYAGVDRYLRAKLGVRETSTRAGLLKECAKLLSNSDLRALIDVLRSGSAQDQKYAGYVSEALRQPTDAERADWLADFFLSYRGDKKESPRPRLMTIALGAANPGLQSLAENARDRFFTLSRELNALTLIDASLALYRVAGHVYERYRQAKRTAGALDFDDLIEKTTYLLSEQSAADWALYKLDGGLDHILIDEAQDTSPEQWQIIQALAREFFSGHGARESGSGRDVRTVFAVGDAKQSIYSFQGAEPLKFAETGERFAQLAISAGQTWHRIPLNLSFRSAAPVLSAVDQVFADASATPGLLAESAGITHIANRLGQAGLVEIWPTERPDESVPADPWNPLADSIERSPANRLADRIANQIDGWLKSGEKLASANRPIRAGDVLILVRKRQPFAIPMVAALKRRGISVAGSDRIALIDQIAVADLMVLGDFLTLPEDDLALATVLKSPMFAFNDDDLMQIAMGRKGSLWKALLAHADDNLFFRPAAETLKRWRAKADFMPPFEFYSSILERDGVRTKLLERLGPEAADALDEFLDYALRHDDSAPPSLTGFLSKLRASTIEVKRDMEHGRDEVRVMTVHGAKGLEAPIVFLPDTCTTASGEANLLELVQLERPEALPPPPVWTVKGTRSIAAVDSARQIWSEREAQERNRLLYVAMTRARDRLYISGFEGKKGKARGCWYDVMTDALKPLAKEIDIGGGVQGWRIEAPQLAGHEDTKHVSVKAAEGSKRPDFALRRAPAEPKLSVPLAPSRLEPYAPDAEGEPIVAERRQAVSAGDSPSPVERSAEYRFLRGTLTHALLQHLPAVPPDKRSAVAAQFVAKRGGELSRKIRDSIVKETLAVLTDATFSALFGPNSMAEVPIAAMIPRPDGNGPALELSGQIDRLAVTDQEVLIVDYKTNRPPPAEVGKVAHAYIYQLAAYRLALREIYPGRRVRAALLWTDGPRLMEIDETILEAFSGRLWALDVASLDAL